MLTNMIQNLCQNSNNSSPCVHCSRRPSVANILIILKYVLGVTHKPCSMDEVIQWKSKQLIKFLETCRGNGTSMISLVIRPSDRISQIAQMLVTEYGTASNIKSRVNRLSVLSAITSTQQKLKLYNQVPKNGLFIYCGTILNEQGKEKKVAIDFEPFKPINTSLYTCDNNFHTSILSSLLSDDDTFGFIIMDGHGTLFATLSGTTKTKLHEFEVNLPKKHRRGGQSSARFARLRMDARHNYLRKVAEIASHLFITDNKVNVTGLVLAGSADFKVELSHSDMFDFRMVAKIIKIVDINHGGNKGFNQAINNAADVLSNVTLVAEQKLLDQYLEKIALDDGKVVYGVQHTMQALEMSAVETLICWESIDIFRVCSFNKSTSSEEVLYLSPMKLQNHTGVISEKICLLDWLSDHYKDYGITLKIVSDKSQEGAQFVNGFGGLGALLRYKVDMQVHEEEDVEEFEEDD